MEIDDAIKIINKYTKNPSLGLPKSVFLLISSKTPLVNVDLLIKDEFGRTLLSWRDDLHSGTGWHIPGGIIRFKEKLEDRLRKVAKSEIGVSNIKYNPKYLEINELIHNERDERSHFISFLYECYLPSDFNLNNKQTKTLYPGFLKWFDHVPDNLIKYHTIYKEYINDNTRKYIR